MNGIGTGFSARGRCVLTRSEERDGTNAEMQLIRHVGVEEREEVERETLGYVERSG